MTSDGSSIRNMCPHCGSSDVLRLGTCNVCGRIVCERCGNTQYSASGKRAYHDDCLRKHGGNDDHFSMIKIVK